LLAKSNRTGTQEATTSKAGESRAMDTTGN